MAASRDHLLMPAPRPAAGGGRWVEVDAARACRWLRDFGERHCEVRLTRSRDYGMDALAGDGSVAQCHVPFPPIIGAADGEGLVLAGLRAHLTARRRVGVLLVRLGGYAVGVFDGDDLVASRVGSRPVHGRAAAGGWSQKRFARRREGQVREADRAAADVTARLLVGRPLDAVVTGGDRRAVAAVLADERLAAVRLVVTERFLTTPDPRKAVLVAARERFGAVHVRVTDPPA